MALRRFTGRRAVSSVIYSDNATYFIAEVVYIKHIQTLPGAKKNIEIRTIEWRNIPARFPAHGEFYERFKVLMKNCIRKVMGKSLLMMNFSFNWN